jgi:hypothetical protein
MVAVDALAAAIVATVTAQAVAVRVVAATLAETARVAGLIVRQM